MTNLPADKTIVLFDGDCGFCTQSVGFLLDHDPTDRFRFAPQRSEAGREILANHGIAETIESLVLIDNGKVFAHSSAVLRLAKRLPWPWKLLAAGWIVPKPIRDVAYRFVAKHRRKLISKWPACRMPTPADRQKFL